MKSTIHGEWILLALAAVTLSWPLMPVQATHDEGCIPGAADPATYKVVSAGVDDPNDDDELGETYYVEDRGIDDGRWTYDETWQIPGLQRGGLGAFGWTWPPVAPIIYGEDPINDETCGHGPDEIIAGGTPTPAAVPQGSISRVSGSDPIHVDGFPFCARFFVDGHTANISCLPGPDYDCVSPHISVQPTTGAMSGWSTCQDSPAAVAAATSPGTGEDLVAGIFAFGWACSVTFDAGATGTATCGATKIAHL